MSQQTPRGPVRLVIGFSPGSASDFIAALIAPALARELDSEVVIERHPGANGAIAARRVAGSAPDGRTLFVATLGTHALARCFNENPGYDPAADFRAVCLLSRSPLVLGCHPSLAAASVAQLIELGRAGRPALTFASSAAGGAPHVAGELFKAMAGIDMTHVVYERTEQLYADLERGRVALSFNNVMSMAPRLRQGVLKGIAVTGSRRSPLLRELPTVAESGLPGYEVTNWLGIVAPARTEDDDVNRLNAAIAAALDSASVRDRLLEAGIEPGGGGPEAFAAHIERELARWAGVAATADSRARAPGTRVS